ncbi:LysE family translocator [Pectobacteriaceae bacterium CE70]|uniref:LysE family translocator n=1 Tax=Serratia sp. (strain ATCC 39006) TaxID=104623 RepID=A0A2I5T274_SERS3|nr:LysE family translocator [Serratia sp. ATCC 39006]WJV62684.1 LysE family translocator [Pectobacteriaceae bacterium C52]WJV67014.1 LysE family translocator [Pectobacteriaceae bacterium CE70]WJY10999.1 LysE family translocator [Pectobacteriaceae bacterium C80]AUG98645.1 LysE family translocator [Serratia sp. ATCC 39006]AUH02960.1 LysE family translocator [Serratia sp. ATCC 39006]
MNIPLLTLYVISIFLLIITPGPVVALIINTTSRCGHRRAILTSIGTNWASLLLIAIAAMVIAGVFSISRTFLNIISLTGCLFLAYIALQSLYQDFRKNNTTGNTISDSIHSEQTNTGFIKGFLVGISNPKDIIFFISFFPQFTGITRSFSISMVVLSSVWIVMDFMILLFYIFITKGTFFSRNKRKVSITSSIFLLLVAIAGFTYTSHELLC